MPSEVKSSLRISTPSFHPRVSVVMPAKNEAKALQTLLPRLREALPEAEIIVVDDGSTDSTRSVAKLGGAHVISHRYSMGNGAAIKTGARAARGEVLVFMDADGQHDAAHVNHLLTHLGTGYDMVVGSRSKDSHASVGRRFANAFYNWLASYMTGQKIDDLTSGFRAARASKFKEFLYLLPNGFSYPTTSTMAFFRGGYSVGYVPIRAGTRVGDSHIRPLRDGLRFLLIIFRIGTLYSPLKLYCPIAGTFFVGGVAYYLYTYLTSGRFTNMSALMLTTAVLIFLIGLVSEQITQLIYRPVHVSGQGVDVGDLREAHKASEPEVRETGT